MFIQTEEYYRDLMLGFGTGSVYNFGCYLVSLVNGLVKFGHNYTPRTFNQLCKDKGLFIGTYKNYIDVDRLSNVLPDIFTGYKRYDSFTMAQLQTALDENKVVVGKVNAVGIGGIGTHFVLIDDIQGANAIIFDPWTGEYQPVANRYGNLGNILGLRVFSIKIKSENNDPSEIGQEENMSNTYQGYDLTNQESMKVAVDVLVRVQKGEFVEASKLDELVKVKTAELSSKISKYEEKTIPALKVDLAETKEKLEVCQNQVQEAPSVEEDLSSFKPNGRNITNIFYNSQGQEIKRDSINFTAKEK
jgi:hypothetical protein